MIKKFAEFINESDADYTPELKEDIKAIGSLDKYEADLNHQGKLKFGLSFEGTPSKDKIKEIVEYINSKAKNYTFEKEGDLTEYPGDEDSATKFVQDLVCKSR